MSDLHAYDTTLRDGAQQEGLNLSVADKLAIASHLDELGVGYIEGGWPGANPKDTEFFAPAAQDLSLPKAPAAEGGKRNITVTWVARGLRDTGMVDAEVKEEAMKLIPLKRMGQADEVAGLVSYLMSDIAAYVTRQVISINGGMV